MELCFLKKSLNFSNQTGEKTSRNFSSIFFELFDIDNKNQKLQIFLALGYHEETNSFQNGQNYRSVIGKYDSNTFRSAEMLENNNSATVKTESQSEVS